MSKNIPREKNLEPLLSYPHNAFLMVRLEFALIFKDDLQTKLLRIIEAHIETQRSVLYRDAINNQRNDPNQVIDIPKDIFVPISYKLFMNDLYDLVTSENTIKKALNALIEYKIIFRKEPSKKKYASPEYSINTTALQILLDALKNPGYQDLIPSILDTLKNSYPQDLIPSWYQDLIPSNQNSSSDEKSRVSRFDTNIRMIENYVSKNECDPHSPTHSLTSLSDEELLAELNRRERERLETATTPSQEIPSANQRNTDGLDPSRLAGMLSAEEQRIHSYWQDLGFEETITPKLKEYWGKLVKSIETFQQFKSLYDHTKLSLKGAKDETVYPGNLVKCLNGWKQKQMSEPEQEKPKNKAKQKITKEYLEMVGY